MKKYVLSDNRIKIEGIYGFESHKLFRRYTDEIVTLYPRLADADRKCVGARMRFRTDSKKLRVEFLLSNQYVDRGMSFYQANTAFAFVGDYSRSTYASLVSANEPYKDEIIF
ncbi:MAG: hypothetical protein IKS28_07995, partial [Clostridia bacterium]|nr:hypothetical protein [Clostridia bacterium]